MEDEAKAGDLFEVVQCNMTQEMQEKALDALVMAANSTIVEKDCASKIKKKMDELDGGTWHCIVGMDFGVSLCSEAKNMLFAKYANDNKFVMLFKSYDVDRHVGEVKM